jgi:DNA-binding LacI/PurR family transcriptional regulator/DNA-binding transcriptional regulator YhcF (GntR family)
MIDKNTLKLDPDSNVSLTAQLVEQIRLLIASGELAPGEQLPPIRELADRLGIHMHTARIAYQRLEEDGLVSIHRRRGTIVREFRPLDWAEKHTPTPTFSFGVLLPSSNPVYDGMIQGITEVTLHNRWLPMFSFTNDNPILTDRLVSQMVARGVDGFIVVATGMMQVFEDAGQMAEFPPIVFVDSPDMPGLRVLSDNAGAAFLSTQHLIEHGHSRIGMVSAPLDWPNVQECYQGYRRALAKHGLAYEPEVVVEAEDFTSNSGFQAGLELFQQPKRPNAVFVAADSLAVGVLQALGELDLRAPQDVALTSFNDSIYAEMTRPQLTSSSFPAYQIGKQAAELLQAAMRGEEIPDKQIVLPSSLAVRQSCGCR